MEVVAVDFGPGEQVMGMEVLDAPKHLGLPKEKPEIKFQILK